MPDLTEIVGAGAAIVGSSIMLPQVIRSLRTKSVRDVSPAMLGLYLLNSVLWLSYGLLLPNFPIIATNVIALLIVSVQWILKMRYDKPL